MRVAIIDYNMGNVESVQKTLKFLNIETIVTNIKEEIASSDIILLPGVGSFKAGMDNLNSLNLVDFLTSEVCEKEKPFLGICLGMQLLATTGNEPIETKGLGWIEGTVIKIDTNLRLPHIGWNDITISNSRYIPSDLISNDFYFIHSYHFKPIDRNYVSSTVNYGEQLVASVEKGNIFATQFHPEKSQQSGITILSKFFSTHA